MAAEVIGLPIEEILGRTNRELGRPAGLALWESTLRRVLDTGVQAEHGSMHDDGTGKLYVNSRLAPIIDEDGVVSGVLAASRDMTDRRLAEDALEQLERVPTIVSVLFLDLDRFKVVNDSLGHAAGDALLEEVASRLSATVRRGDTIARPGGDEFVVLCENLASDDVIRELAERIESALAVPFVVDGHEVSIGAS
ncbi:MAG TPA: diguanylate cyclase, partial [Mycobacteriales bacterium]|nr:diguanylate cyclase [Mycobacteriales bacterium]